MAVGEREPGGNSVVFRGVAGYDVSAMITLPRDLHTALKLMRRSRPLRRMLGDEFIQVYVAIKELEYETFFQVISSWEREHLLLNV